MNAKHTRLNGPHRDRCRVALHHDEPLASAHDAVRTLNNREQSTVEWLGQELDLALQYSEGAAV